MAIKFDKEIKKTLSKTLLDFKTSHEDEKVIFIANASLMYLDKSEKLQILNMPPRDTLIVITEPKDKTYTDIFDKTKVKIQLQTYIPQDVYNPGYKSEILIVIKN